MGVLTVMVSPIFFYIESDRKYKGGVLYYPSDSTTTCTWLYVVTPCLYVAYHFCVLMIDRSMIIDMFISVMIIKYRTLSFRTRSTWRLDGSELDGLRGRIDER